MDFVCFTKDSIFFNIIGLLHIYRLLCLLQGKRGSCGHAMASFDGHAFCACCREKGKGKEPCIADKDRVDCEFCNLLSPEQRAQTPSYKLKKEKREAKRVDHPNPTGDSSLVDPSTVSVIGVVGAATSEKSPVPPEKKTKKDKVPVKAKKDKASTSTAADRFSELDQKWSERFNRLEALLLSKSLQPTFSPEVRVTPSHSPPVNVSRDTEPFFQPTHRNLGDSSPKRTGPDISAAQQPSASKLTSHSSTSSSAVKRTGPDSTAAKQKLTGKLKLDQIRPKSSTGCTGPDTATVKSKSIGKPHIDSHRPSSRPVQSASTSPADPPLSDRPSTDQPQHSVASGSESPSLWKSSRKDSISSLESEVDTDLSDRPPVELFVEEGELSDEQELTEHDLPTSEEQTYRETMGGIRSFMGWSHVPDADSTNPSDDNPFAGPKTPAPSKVSVHVPTEEWLCKKLSRLNITLVEGYPSRTAEAGSLPMDHFLKTPRSQAKWYGRSDTKQERPAWKNIGRRQFKRSRGKNNNFSSRPAKGQQTFKDSCCLTPAQARLLIRSICKEQTIDTFSKQPVNLNVVNVVPSAPGHSQKRGLSPGLADCQSQNVHKLKYVKGVSCVTQLSCVPNARNVPSRVGTNTEKRLQIQIHLFLQQQIQIQL